MVTGGNRVISLNLGCKMNAERVTCVNLSSMSGGIEKVAYFVFGRNVDRNLEDLKTAYYCCIKGTTSDYEKSVKKLFSR